MWTLPRSARDIKRKCPAFKESQAAAEFGCLASLPLNLRVNPDGGKSVYTFEWNEVVHPGWRHSPVTHAPMRARISLRWCGSGGPGPGAGKGDLGCRRPAADAAADRVPAPVCRRHGSSGNCRSHRDEGRDGKDTPLSGAPIGTRQAGGNEMSKHLTEQGVSMYLIGDVSMEERTHAEECAACQAKIANLTTSIAHFRGAVRNWSDRARAKDRAAELRWTVIPASDHLERLLLPALDLPWYRSLWSGIHDLFQPAPPLLDITAKPVLVRNIWGQYGRQKKSWVMSVALQSAVVVLVFTDRQS